MQDLVFEVNDFVHADVIEVSFNGYVDGLYLVFDGVRGVLRSLQDFGGSLAAVDLCLGGRIEVGAELCEGCQFSELGKVQTEGAGYLFHGFNLGSAAYTGYGEAYVDCRTDTGVEEAGFQINLAVGDGNNVGRNVCAYVACQGFNDWESL